MRDYVNKQYTLAHTKYTADDEYVTPMALDSDGNLLYKEEAVNCYKNIPYILTNNSYFRKEYESSYTNAEVDDVKFSAFETAMEHKCHNIGFSPDDICNLINYASEVIAAENIKFASIGELMRLLDKTAEKGFTAQDTSSK